ncbi:catabolite control protein A [Ketogulonicigenium vulgare]|uniref:Catabolite control protein A (Glucose-resistance amylase regulator) n=2 Tax=Ketogulonicigenium vulgare TaxID=92945 RepID=F9Y8Z2_KETVW|nr:Catabolite control protein A (Glucose-resistance amylase regulator) [Ketogulonicigenium vulgare WSH-001]ALJ82240.1 catabolite control protein A [Ketogulonicigenium vulgare]ANW34900.1 catabolite control protein A [Ketogulonicigenium vulgare]
MGDVARLAGVSPATVARVLYEPEKVALARRQKVQAAIEATGYRPNVVARGLRTSRTWKIGLIIVDGRLNPYFVNLSQAIRLAAMAEGYTALTFQYGSANEPVADAVQQLILNRVDAVIFSYALRPEDIAPLTAANIPVVQVEQEAIAGTDAVMCDPAPGIRAAIAHLTALGHQRIAFMGGDPAAYARPRVHGTTMEEERLAAFRSAVRDLGADSDPSLEVLGRYFTLSGLDPSKEGRAMMQRILDMDQPPTAILASSDMLAAGILQVLNAAGKSVPGDFSVIGYDDSISSLLAPPVTSIGRPLQQIAKTTLDLAIAAITDADHRPMRRVFDTSLTVRASTAAPKS